MRVRRIFRAIVNSRNVNVSPEDAIVSTEDRRKFALKDDEFPLNRDDKAVARLRRELSEIDGRDNSATSN